MARSRATALEVEEAEVVQRRRVDLIGSGMEPIEGGASVRLGTPTSQRGDGKIHHGSGSPLARFSFKDFVSFPGSTATGSGWSGAACCRSLTCSHPLTGLLPDRAYANAGPI